MNFSLNSLNWFGPKVIPTKYGLKECFIASVEDVPGFKDAWLANKDQWRLEGYSLYHKNGKWRLYRWGDPIVSRVSEVKEIQSSEYEEEILKASKKLLSYQVPSLRRLVNALGAYGAALDASQTGTGKTHVALAVCNVLGLKPIIICPKAIIPGWKKACKYHGIKFIGIINWEMARTGKTKFGSWHDGKGSSFIWKDFGPKACLIFDEVHKARSSKSQASELVIAAKRQSIRTLALSATAAQSPLDMKALGYLLGLHDLDDFWHWGLRHGIRKVPYKNRAGGFHVFSGSVNDLSRIHAQIFPHKGTRIKISDLGDAFPKTQVLAEAYDCGDPAKINRVYEEMEAELADLQAREDMDARRKKANELTIILRARQRTELIKVPTFCEMASDCIEQGMSVALFLNFTESVDAVLGRMKTCCFIDGRQVGDKGASERQRNIDLFQSDKEPLIVCNIQAGGVGISLHDVHGKRPRMAIISPSFSAIDTIQALGRVHRSGGKTMSFQRIVYAADTIEERVCDTVRVKLKQIKRLNEG